MRDQTGQRLNQFINKAAPQWFREYQDGLITKAEVILWMETTLGGIKTDYLKQLQSAQTEINLLTPKGE